MSSSLGAMSSLVRLFGLLGIPKRDKTQLQQQHGISTPNRLVSKRAQLARSLNPTCRLLVAAIDYIAFRQKDHKPQTEGAQPVVHQCFESSGSLETSWEHCLAQKILHARSHRQQLAIDKATTARNPKNASKVIPLQDQKGYRQGDKYWEDLKNAKADSEGNVTAEMLGIADETSPWEFHCENQEVLLTDPSHRDSVLLRLPVTVFRDLYGFQRVGVHWMTQLYQNDCGGILGDEMGMGKTRQTLVLLLGLMCAGTIRNALIVCPKSVLDATWLKEVTKLIPFFEWKQDKPKVVMAASKLTERQRLQVLKLARNCSEQTPHIIITSYPQVQQTKRGFMPGNGVGSGLGFFQVVVLDEAHRVKNAKSKLRKHLDIISKKSCKLLLTGTPILNRLEELHSLLKLAAPEDFGEWARFRDQYARPIEASRQPSASKYEIQRGEKLVAELQKKIQPFLLQRHKRDHLKSTVPLNFEFDVWTRLSKEQRRLYEDFVKDGKLVAGISNRDVTCVLPAIHQLRKLCNHPLLFQHALNGDKKTVQQTLENQGKDKLVAQSPKMGVMMEVVHKWRREGYKILIFSHSVLMLNIIQFVLVGEAGIQVSRIDGSTSQKKRQELVQDFNRVGSKFNVMLLSVEAGGEGLTLTGANKSILYDPAWTLAKSDQAVARTCRPGQLRECEAIHLISAGTVEEKMYGKQMYKGGVEGTILANRSKGFEMRNYDKDELTRLFELDPEGKCDSLDISQKHQGVTPSYHKCSTTKSHKSVVGISRRNSVKSK